MPVKQFETFNIAQPNGPPKVVKAELVDLPVSGRGSPSLWLQNPRIMLEIQKIREREPQKRFTSGEILSMIMSTAGAPELAQGIEKTGKTWDRILIDAKGVIREGNTRYACYHSLNERNVVGFSTIPCLAFPAGVTEADWETILSLRHVTQQRNWPSIAKAIHCQKMQESGWSEDQITAHFGWSSKQQVRAFIKAAEYLELYFKKYGYDIDQDRFSCFWKLGGCARLQRTIAELGLFDKFCKLVRDKKINDCRHVVGVLDKIWCKPEFSHLAKLLETEGSEECRKVIENETDSDLLKRIERMSRSLGDIQKKNFNEFKTSPEMDPERVALSSLYYQIQKMMPNLKK